MLNIIWKGNASSRGNSSGRLSVPTFPHTVSSFKMATQKFEVCICCIITGPRIIREDWTKILQNEIVYVASSFLNCIRLGKLFTFLLDRANGQNNLGLVAKPKSLDYTFRLTISHVSHYFGTIKLILEPLGTVGSLIFH